MTATSEAEPPFVDEHTVDVAASTERTWQALSTYLDGVLARPTGSPFTRLLGAVPASGFAVSSRVPEVRVELTGRHRFSRYRLVFTIVPGTRPETARLSATTYAAFPGPHGAAYRLLVVSSRLHVLATRRMLASVARRSDLGTPRPPRR